MNEELVKQLTEWVVKNRKGPSFQYPHNKVASLIKRAIEQDVFVFMHKGELSSATLVGIACGERNDLEHYIRIHDVLCTQPGIVKKFVEFCISKYPGYAIYGTVRGRDRLINNPIKFARRLK